MAAKRRQVASDTRRFHPARMHALHTDVVVFQAGRARASASTTCIFWRELRLHCG
jgi:hypothetical protein